MINLRPRRLDCAKCVERRGGLLVAFAEGFAAVVVFQAVDRAFERLEQQIEILVRRPARRTHDERNATRSQVVLAREPVEDAEDVFSGCRLPRDSRVVLLVHSDVDGVRLVREGQRRRAVRLYRDAR